MSLSAAPTSCRACAGLPSRGPQRYWEYRSARVTAPELVGEYPTAVHAAAEMHEMPPRLAPAAPVGFGVAWMDQPLPFHASASVPFGPSPVAVHIAVEEHDAPERTPKLTAGEGDGR